MSKKSKRAIVNTFFLVAFSLIVIILLVNRDADDLWKILPYISGKWFLITFLFFMLYYVIDGFSLMIMGKKFKKNYSFHEAFAVAWVGSFFSAITPSATGGQVGQAYVLRKQGIHLEEGASLLVLQWAAKEVAVILFCSVTIVASRVMGLNTITSLHIFGVDMDFWIFALIGFVLHLGATVGVLTLSFSHYTETLVYWLLKMLLKLKFIKEDKYKANCAKVQTKIDRYRQEVKDMKGNYKYLIGALFCEILRYIVYFSIPWFVSYILRVDLPLDLLWVSIIYGSFLFLISAFIPIPGASGGTEVFFSIIFASFYGVGGATTSALIIWRFITFYAGLIIGGIVTWAYNKRKNVNLVEEAMEDQPKHIHVLTPLPGDAKLYKDKEEHNDDEIDIKSKDPRS